MAQEDGVVRIVTKITTKDAEESLSSLEYAIKKSVKEIDSLRSKMDALKNQKIPTKEYKELQNKLSEAEKNLSVLISQQEEWEKIGITSGAGWDELNEKIATAGDKVDEIKEKMQALTDTGKDFILGKDTAEYASYARQIQYEEKAIISAGERYKRLLDSQSGSLKKISDIAKKSLDSVGNMLKKINFLVDSFAKRIKSAFSNISKSATAAGKGFSGISSSLKNILKYSFGISSLYVLVNKLRSGIKEGFENLLTYSKTLENSINDIKATALTLKNAFAAAFSPFVEIALPYVQKLLDYMVQLVNIAGQFFAAITGRKTYIRAIKQTTDALKEETKEMNKQLSPLDKLNNLSSQKSTGTDVGTGGTMFEEVPIENDILNVAEKIKDILSKLFEPLKEAWNREGKFVMDSWKYALEEVWKLIKNIGRDFLTFWQEEATIKIFQDILHIIGDIGLVVGHLARNFREAWNTNEVGLNILRNIRDIIGIIVQHIRNAADATVEWADKLNFYPLLDAFKRFLDSIKPVVDAIWGILEDFYTKVLLPLSKWTIEKGLPELLQVFIDFNNKVDWESLRKNIAEFWEHLEPFAETVGEGLIIFINRVADALANFLNSQEFKDFLVTIENWMDSVTPEDVADALEKLAKGLIALKVALLGFGAIKGIVSAFTTLKTFFDFIRTAGSVVGTIISSLTTVLSKFIPVLGAIAIGALAGEKLAQGIGKILNIPVLKLKEFPEAFKEIKNSFIDGSWKEALSLWGEEISAGLGELFKGIKEDIFNFSTTIDLFESASHFFAQAKTAFENQDWAELAKNILLGIAGGLLGALSFLTEPIKNIFDTIYNGICDLFGIHSPSTVMATVGNNIIFGLLNGLKEKWKDITDWIQEKVRWLTDKIQSMVKSIGAAKSALTGGLGGALGNAFKNLSLDSGIQVPVSPVVAALSNVEIPAYATGQVIPRTMKQHLAILGDNTKETEVVSPLSTIEQAVENVLSRNNGGGGGDINLNLTVECEGYQLLNIIQKLDRQFYKQNGRHAFS